MRNDLPIIGLVLPYNDCFSSEDIHDKLVQIKFYPRPNLSNG